MQPCPLHTLPQWPLCSANPLSKWNSEREHLGWISQWNPWALAAWASGLCPVFYVIAEHTLGCLNVIWTKRWNSSRRFSTVTWNMGGCCTHRRSGCSPTEAKGNHLTCARAEFWPNSFACVSAVCGLRRTRDLPLWIRDMVCLVSRQGPKQIVQGKVQAGKETVLHTLI